MAKKKTGLYRVDVEHPEGKAHKYYYGRNSRVVEEAALEFYRDLRPFSVKAIQVGVFAYTLTDPVVAFTDEEEKQIEAYYTKEALKYVAFQGQLTPGPSLPGKR